MPTFYTARVWIKNVFNNNSLFFTWNETFCIIIPYDLLKCWINFTSKPEERNSLKPQTLCSTRVQNRDVLHTKSIPNGRIRTDKACQWKLPTQDLILNEWYHNLYPKETKLFKYKMSFLENIRSATFSGLPFDQWRTVISFRDWEITIYKRLLLFLPPNTSMFVSYPS